MKERTRWFSGIGMSCSPAWMSDLTVFCSSALAVGGASVADTASSSSMDAGSYLLLGEAVALGKRLHLVGADPIHQAIELFPDPRFGAAAKRRLDQQVDGPVEFLPGPLDVSGFEFELTGLEMTIRLGDQRQDRVFVGDGGTWIWAGGVGDDWGRRRGGSERRLPDARSARGHDGQQREESQARY